MKQIIVARLLFREGLDVIVNSILAQDLSEEVPVREVCLKRADDLGQADVTIDPLHNLFCCHIGRCFFLILLLLS